MQVPYYYLIMSQKEMLENQVLEEILRERSSYYLAQSKPQDFWISLSPLFLSSLSEKIKNSAFYRQQSHLFLADGRPFYSVLFTTNKEFLDWLKLRLGDFENLQAIDTEQKLVSDGIYGESSFSTNLWQSKNDFLHPDFFEKKYDQILEVFFSGE
jgi:hypothetical protein